MTTKQKCEECAKFLGVPPKTGQHAGVPKTCSDPRIMRSAYDSAQQCYVAGVRCALLTDGFQPKSDPLTDMGIQLTLPDNLTGQSRFDAAVEIVKKIADHVEIREDEIIIKISTKF